MIEEKFLEIRDEGTHIPALAFVLSPADDKEKYIMQRAGYGDTVAQHADYVFLMKLDGAECRNDPYDWDSVARTMRTAHSALVGQIPGTFGPEQRARWDEVRFDNLTSGDVLDVEYLLGERETKKISERLHCKVCFGYKQVRQGEAMIDCSACYGTGLKDAKPKRRK
jgi:hypothetical protein